jgi:chromosome condensin MukBEF MukE localization factor
VKLSSGFLSIIKLLDMCLTMGSKDNMTALVIRFPAEKIGEGGGVKARRDKREATARANEAGNHHDSDHEHTEPEDSKMEETNEDSTAT